MLINDARFSECCDWGTGRIGSSNCNNSTTVCNQFPSGMAATWEFTVAGVTPVTGNTCTGSPCNYWNGTKQVTIDETPFGGGARECWFPGSFQNLSIRDPGPPATCVTSGGCAWLLWYDSANLQGAGVTWILQANYGGNFLESLATYALKTGTSFKRFSANTFELRAVDAINCEGWPTEITIEPVCS